MQKLQFFRFTPQDARPLNKPDPYLVLSVGKKSEQTAVQMRTDAPVWEQGFTFLVPNPANDTLSLRIVDQKTEKELGNFVYTLSALLEKNDMEMVSQPYQLAKSGAESKITMSLCLRILKNGTPAIEGTEPTATSTTPPPMTNATSATTDDALSRGSSIRQSTETSPLLVPSSSSLRKQDSKISSNTDTDSGMIQDEVMVLAGVASQLSSSPAQSSNGSEISGPQLIHRTPSVTSSAGSAGLGRIQLTLRYSAQRQKLVVIIHKIM